MSFLKATFWISFFLALKNNLRSIYLLMIWVLGFFLVDYFYAGLQGVLTNESLTLLAFVLKSLAQLAFVFLIVFRLKKLFVERAQLESAMPEETADEACQPIQKPAYLFTAKTKKQRIFEKYTQQAKKPEESNHE